MPIFFQDLNRQLLVNQVVLSEKNVEHDVGLRSDRTDSVRFEGRNQCGRQVLRAHRRRYLRADTVVQTPLDYNAEDFN